MINGTLMIVSCTHLHLRNINKRSEIEVNPAVNNVLEFYGVINLTKCLADPSFWSATSPVIDLSKQDCEKWGMPSKIILQNIFNVNVPELILHMSFYYFSYITFVESCNGTNLHKKSILPRNALELLNVQHISF